MRLSWAEKSFILGLLDKRLLEVPDCESAKKLKERILASSPVLARMIYNRGRVLPK